MDVEKQIEFLLQNQASHDAKIGQLLDMQRRNEDMQRRNEVLIAQVIESIDSLARIAHVHEQRIDRLENH